MHKEIRKILSSSCLSEDNHGCEYDGNCYAHENAKIEELIAKHDSELLDKVGEYLFNSRYASDKIADFDYDQTVTFSKLEWLQIIAELKAEVEE